MKHVQTAVEQGTLSFWVFQVGDRILWPQPEEIWSPGKRIEKKRMLLSRGA